MKMNGNQKKSKYSEQLKKILVEHIGAADSAMKN